MMLPTQSPSSPSDLLGKHVITNHWLRWWAIVGGSLNPCPLPPAAHLPAVLTAEIKGQPVNNHEIANAG